LDCDRLAGNDGRRGAKRISGGRSDHGIEGLSPAFSYTGSTGKGIDEVSLGRFSTCLFITNLLDNRRIISAMGIVDKLL
jgi:hypothetical protein